MDEATRNATREHPRRRGRRWPAAVLGCALAAAGLAAVFWHSSLNVQAGILQWVLDTQAQWDGYSAVKTNVVSTAAGDIQLQAGTTWASVTSSTSAGTMDIWSVDMFHGTFGKAVANNGTNSDILTWNGTSWSRDTTLSGVLLYAIDVVSPTSAWAVGGCGGKDCVYYWNGSTWSQIVNNKAGNVLYAVSMIDGDSGWAAGNGGVSLYCTSNCASGANWVVGPIFKDSQKSAAVAQTVRDLQMLPEYGFGWGVGDNGTVWMLRDNRAGPLDNIVIPKNPLAGSGVVLYDVYAVSGIDAWAVGASGKVMYYDGTNWNDKTAEVNKNITMYGVHAVDTTGDRKTDKVWIVGSGGNIGVGTCSGSPLVTCTWTWSTAPGGYTGNLYDTFMHNANAGWAVGQDNGTQGMIFKYGGYPSSGTAQYTFDSGQVSKWLSHAYTATPGPAGAVVFEWAYSDNGTTWSAWQAALPTDRNSRWLRQRVTLSTSDWSLTPRVHSSTVTYNTDGTPPATPSGLSAAAGDGRVTLNWTANSESDLAGYNIYRATSAGGPYTKINGATVTGTTYLSNGLANGTTYYFKITALDTAGNESPQTSYVSATPVNVAPATPSGLGATPSDRQVTLTWNANTEWDLAGYNIYRATGEGGPYTQINSGLVAGTTYAATGLINGTTYYFKITAVDATALESAQTAAVSATPRDYTAPAAPAGLTVTPGDSQLTLDWTANGEYDVAGYNIYRAMSETGPYTRLTSQPVAATTYQETGLANGTTYWYRITAVDTSGNESSQSAAKSGMPRDASPPAAPTGLVAEPRTSKVILIWNNNAEPDLKGYHVYRAVYETGPYTRITGVPVTVSRYSDTGLANGTTYWYKVTAVDVSTNESGYSDPTGATPNFKLYSGPTNVKTEVVSPGGIRTVRVLFTPDEDGVSYTVYRHAYGDGRAFKQVGGSVYYTGGTITSADPNWGYLVLIPGVSEYVYYNDTSVTDYEEYYYLIRAGTDPAWPVDEETGLEYAPVEDYNVAPAFPPAQTPHGQFTETTNACTICHGLHSAPNTKLIKARTITDLCASCHDGSSSKYDMVMGRVRTGADWTSYTNNPAGAFGTQLKDVAGAPVMNSVHNVWREGLTAGASPSATAAQYWQAPGSTYLTAPNPDPGTWLREFVCTGCHNPHNWFQNFRLLRADFNAGSYVFPDRDGAYRAKVVVRGVSEVNLGYPGGGQMASRYLAGNSGDTGSGITNFCTGCHRAFAGPYNEKYPTLTAGYDPYDPVYENVYDYTWSGSNADNDALDNPGTHGWKRHMMAMPADYALLYSGDRVIDTGRRGATSSQSRLVDWDGTNLPIYIPLEGPFEDNNTPGNGYARNKVVCLTCHVPHGSPRAAGGFGPDGEVLNLENAYRNDLLNGTENMPRQAGDCPPGTTATQVDGEWYCEGTVNGTVYELGRNPVSGYLHYREKGLIMGSSSVLARFEPFASACWRCHSTK